MPPPKLNQGIKKTESPKPSVAKFNSNLSVFALTNIIDVYCSIVKNGIIYQLQEGGGL